MKETYEKISIDISVLNMEDVITTSSNYNDDHDNGFVDWDELE